jgi:hypothetical protein
VKDVKTLDKAAKATGTGEATKDAAKAAIQAEKETQ